MKSSQFVDEGGEAVETVLGLSMTSSSIGWVLFDGPGADANILDHDAFDVGAGAANDGDISKQTAAVLGAQAIATASGHEVKSIGVTWSDDADAKATLLLKTLPDMGFENIVSVPLPQATRTWAQTFGPTLGFEKCAVCIVEPSAVTVLTFGFDTVRTAGSHMRESVDGLGRWLTDVFAKSRVIPDSLYLVGSRGDLELISGTLGELLPMPIVASDDAQLALARGAALAASPESHPVDEQVTEKIVEVIPAKRRPRFGEHARAATVLVAGVIALFALGPYFAGHPDSKPTESRPAANTAPTSVPSAVPDAATTSVSVHAVPAPAAAPPAPPAVQPLAAEPAPSVAPPPPPAEVAVTEDPAEAAIVEEPSAAEPVTAEPLVAPQPPTQPAAIAAAPAPAAPLAPQPVPAAPGPAPLPAEGAPPQAPAAAAPPGAPAPTPLPPDPVAQVLSPIFGALP
jgi:hypothetical protein